MSFTLKPAMEVKEEKKRPSLARPVPPAFGEPVYSDSDDSDDDGGHYRAFLSGIRAEEPADDPSKDDLSDDDFSPPENFVL